jgi:hypothetical protein
MLNRRTTGGASAERRAEGAAEAGMPFFDLYGKMKDDLLAGRKAMSFISALCIPLTLSGLLVSMAFAQQPDSTANRGVKFPTCTLSDRRNMAKCFRLWNALLWDRPEQRLFLPA